MQQSKRYMIQSPIDRKAKYTVLVMNKLGANSPITVVVKCDDDGNFGHRDR